MTGTGLFALPPGTIYVAEQGANVQSSLGELNVGLSIAQLGPMSGTPYVVPEYHLRPRDAVILKRFYIPVCVTFRGDAASASSAQILLQLSDRSSVFFSWYSTLALQPGAGNYASGNDILSEDLVNPIRIDLTDSPSLKASVLYDQAGIGSFYVCAQAPAVGALSSTAGSAEYTIGDD